MPDELERPTTAIAPEMAFAALLHLFYRHAQYEDRGQVAPACLKRRICQHLGSLAAREDVSLLLRRSCDDLLDVWEPRLHASLLQGVAA